MFFFSVIGIFACLFGGYCLIISNGSGGYGCAGLVGLILGVFIILAGIMTSFSNGDIISGIFSIILVIAAIVGAVALLVWLNKRD